MKSKKGRAEKEEGSISSSQHTELVAGVPILDDIIYHVAYYKAHRITLQKIVNWLNESDLGCRVRRNDHPLRKEAFKNWFETTHIKMPNISGTAKDGRAIYIQFYGDRKRRKPFKNNSAFLREQAALNAIVGCAYDYSDCYDIISCSEKRKPRTYSYRETANGKTQKNRNNDYPKNKFGTRHPSDPERDRDGDGSDGSGPND